MTCRKLGLIWCALFSAVILRSASAQSAHPNIIFILVDDQRWDALGCMGHPFVKYPNIDRIADEGAKFTNYFVSIPLCSPSRASILSSQYSHKNGIIDNTNRSEQSFALKTFPQELQKAGYETEFLGKWHMGTDPNPRPGWDRWIAMPGQGKYIDCPLNIDGKMTPSPGYITDVLDGYATNFIRAKHDKPWFLYLGEKAWHDPHTPAERDKNLYAGEKIQRAPSVNDDLSGKPVLQRAMKYHQTTGYSDEAIMEQLRTIQSVDDSVGNMFKALQETGQLDNTVIIYSSDNGYFWGEHQLGDKRAAYDEGIRDPLLIRYPKLIKPGTVIDQLTMNIDIGPTILELAGAAIPSSYQGKSWMQLFKDDLTGWRNEILTEYFAEKNYPYMPSWQSVRSEQWKLIHYTEVKDSDELYDLKNDKYEMKNLIGDPSEKEILVKLETDLEKLVKQTS